MVRYFYYDKFFSKKKKLSQELFFLNFKQEITSVNKIQVQISFKDTFFKTFNYMPYFVFLLEFFCNQKVCLGFSKKDVSFWRLRKKAVVSLFVTLRGSAIFNFLEKFVTFFSPKVIVIDNKKLTYVNNTILFVISDFQLFNELETEIFKIQLSKLRFLNVNIKVIFVFNSNIKRNECNLLRDFQIPFYF